MKENTDIINECNELRKLKVVFQKQLSEKEREVKELKKQIECLLAYAPKDLDIGQFQSN